MPYDHAYDVVIVGAGPAGLSAARTAARLGFRSLLLERLSQAGELKHPCTGVITPVPGFVGARRLLDGLFLPSVDLLIPASLILGYPQMQRMISPSGYQYTANFGAHGDFPAAVVDKPGLLQMLARQARSAGVALRFGAGVDELLRSPETGAIDGVRVGEERIGARLVISAEGTARHLCRQAGIGSDAPVRKYLVLVSQEMEAPAVRAEDVGQILTVGRRYTSAQRAWGMLVLPAPGRATIFFTLYVDADQAAADSFLWFYLDEYVQTDVRVRDLLAGSRVLGRSRHKIAMRDAPATVVADGFLAVGDAITPAGHLGILPSIFMGRQAALMASEALDSGNVSAAALAPYDQMLHETILPNLEAEAKIMLGLTRLSDEDVDRLTQALGEMSLPTPVFSNWRTLAWDMIGWMVRRFPQMIHNWQSLQEASGGPAAESGLRA